MKPVHLRWIAAALVLGLLVPGPGPAVAARRAPIAAYRGLAAWIDIYDHSGWADPEGTVAAMRAYDVRTLFLETCNYRCRNHLHRPDRISRWIDAAHANGMRIVAWYLPGFDDLRRDRVRSMAAIRFRSNTGQRFDSFALDIEARLVNPVGVRNRRLVSLSRRIRKNAGRRYPLGAITPVWFYEWGGEFPYAELARWYDVFVPMIYFSGRAEGGREARRHTIANIDQIRQAVGDPRMPIHAIGGIADELSGREVGAFVRTARGKRAVGVSLYDYFTSGPEDWSRLRAAG